jgi:N,N'-diacetyllegionaminate synthase
MASLSFKIGTKKIYKHPKKCFVIAEIGINHLGNFELCKKLILSAAKSQADAVKLQTLDPDESYIKDTLSYKQFKNTQFTMEEMFKLKKIAKKKNLAFFSTPGDFSSLYQLVKLRVDAIKISSGLMTNTPLIKEAAKSGLPIIISLGMGKKNEIINAYEAAIDGGSKKISLLKCTSLYPAPPNTLNLNNISILKKMFNIPIGYSDHTLDDLAAVTSVSLGATILEKHFTIDKKLKGGDNKISMMPDDFSKMVSKIRLIEKMLGNSEIEPNKIEIPERNKRHRFIVAKRDILKNETINIENIAFKRIKKPSKVALLPINFKNVVNKKIKKKIKKDSLIQKNFLI